MDDRSATPGLRLLRTKLAVPGTYPELVERPWLMARLGEGLHRRMVLVIAPAGSGKTTLLATWLAGLASAAPHDADSRAASRVLQSAWLSLDERDNEPVRFWTYVIAALQTVQPDLGVTPRAMLQAPQAPAVEVALTELLNELAGIAARDVVLVLDDYHAIGNQAIHDGMAFFLEQLPPWLHLVIASRVEPPLPLALWRARRALVELGVHDLRFSAEDAAALFNRVMSLDLDRAQVRALADLTEGWIAGLQLAAIALQGDRLPAGAASREQAVAEFIRSFSGSHRYVFDYLAQEVLNRQPEDVQRFLLQTSVLDRLTGGLCDAVTGSADGAAMLERLAQANLFVVRLDSQRQWYRYHHLFADFLRAQWERESGGATPAGAFGRASDWCAGHDQPGDAIGYALRTGDYARVLALLAIAAPEAFARADLVTAREWLRAVPIEVLRTSPQLCMCCAWALLATSTFDAVEPYLQSVEAALGARADGAAATLELPPETRGGLAEISIIRANLAFQRMDLPGAVTEVRRATTYLSDNVQGGFLQNSRDLRAVVAFNRGLTEEFGGAVAEAMASFGECLSVSRDEHNVHLVLFAASHLAQLQVACGLLRRAAETYRQALQTVEALAVPPSPIAGLASAGLGHLQLEWRDFEQAEASFRRGVERGRLWANWETLMLAYSGLAELRIAQGQWPAAVAMLDELDSAGRAPNSPWGASAGAAYRAVVHAHTGEVARALAWAQDVAPEFAGPVPPQREGEALLLIAVLCDCGRPDEALPLCTRLLSAASAAQRHGIALKLHVLHARILAALGRQSQAEEALAHALELGMPEGYLQTFVAGGEAARALLAHVAGGRHAPPVKEYARRVLAAFPEAGVPAPATASPAPGSLLSAREHEVLKLMARGLTNQQIADELVVSLNTVKSHVKNIHARLDAANRTEAVARARERGLL